MTNWCCGSLASTVQVLGCRNSRLHLTGTNKVFIAISYTVTNLGGCHCIIIVYMYIVGRARPTSCHAYSYVDPQPAEDLESANTESTAVVEHGNRESGVAGREGIDGSK